MTSSNEKNPFLPLSWIAACLLAFAAAPVAAADPEYQLLVVACDKQDCKRIAEPRVSARAGVRSAYAQSDMKVEIETLASRADDVDVTVRVEIARKGALLMLPCRITSRTLTSLATFVSEGTIYHVWGKMLPATVAMGLQ